MKVYKLVFSPTGTSARIADAVACGVAAAMHGDVVDSSVTYSPADAMTFPSDCVAVIAAPVYGGKMAPIAKERLKDIQAQSTPCVLIAVYGNRAFEHALVDMKDFVEALGFTPIAAGAFIGEHSYSTEATPIAVGRPDSMDIADAKSFGYLVGQRLLTGEKNIVDVQTLHDGPSSETAMTNFLNFVKGYAAQQQTAPRRFLPEVDADACNACGTCRDVCPTGAIADDCISVDPAKCIKCCACVKACVSNARKLHSPFAPVLSANFNVRKSPVWIVG